MIEGMIKAVGTQAAAAPEFSVLLQGLTQALVAVARHKTVDITPGQADAHTGKIQSADILDHSSALAYAGGSAPGADQSATPSAAAACRAAAERSSRK